MIKNSIEIKQIANPIYWISDSKTSITLNNLNFRDSLFNSSHTIKSLYLHDFEVSTFYDQKTDLLHPKIHSFLWFNNLIGEKGLARWQVINSFNVAISVSSNEPQISPIIIFDLGNHTFGRMCNSIISKDYYICDEGRAFGWKSERLYPIELLWDTVCSYLKPYKLGVEVLSKRGFTQIYVIPPSEQIDKCLDTRKQMSLTHALKNKIFTKISDFPAEILKFNYQINNLNYSPNFKKRLLLLLLKTVNKRKEKSVNFNRFECLKRQTSTKPSKNTNWMVKRKEDRISEIIKNATSINTLNQGEKLANWVQFSRNFEFYNFIELSATCIENIFINYKIRSKIEKIIGYPFIVFNYLVFKVKRNRKIQSDPRIFNFHKFPEIFLNLNMKLSTAAIQCKLSSKFDISNRQFYKNLKPNEIGFDLILCPKLKSITASVINSKDNLIPLDPYNFQVIGSDCYPINNDLKQVNLNLELYNFINNLS